MTHSLSEVPVSGGEILNVHCPICQSPSVKALTKEERPYYRCGQCDFLFHRPEMGRPEEPARKFYDEGYWQMERTEALRREKDEGFMRALELLFISTIKVQNILDFGCGLGVTVRLLRERLGLNAVGVDISADFEEADFLHRCDLDELREKYPPQYFDAIYSIEVFEHLEDPVQVLSALHSFLKPGGKILINTCTQEQMAKYDPEMTYIDPVRRGHISIYSLKSFSQLASAIGYISEFLAGRRYVVILSPPEGNERFPHPDNLGRVGKLGDWCPGLFAEYMRLVSIEGEFEEKCLWSAHLLAELDSLRLEYAAVAEQHRRQGKQLTAAKEQLVAAEEASRNKIRQLAIELEALRGAHEALRSRWPLRAARALRSIARKFWKWD